MARRNNEAVANPARGAALVVVAVLVGLFLLRNGLDTSEVVVASPGDNTSTDSGTDLGATDSGTDEGATDGTVTTEPVLDPTQVQTIVLNGSGVSGAAKRYSALLQGAGYTLTNPEGGNATNNVSTTQVLYAPGFEDEAQVLATTLATASGAPTPAPAPLGTVLPGTTNNAQVVVVLGPDMGEVNPNPGT